MSKHIHSILIKKYDEKPTFFPGQQLEKNEDVTQRRNTRFDKTHDIKFPVSLAEERELRRLFKCYQQKYNISSITQFCTVLLRYGLLNQNLISRLVEYQDTKKYKHVKPNQVEYELIGGINGLAIEWGISERKAVHRIVISVLNYLSRGGALSNEALQPFKPDRKFFK